MNGKVFWACCGFLALLSAFSADVHAEEPKHILSIEAYDMLNTVPDTYLIDVRTRAEYQFVGHPINAYLFPYMFWTPTLKKEGDRYEYGINKKNKAFLKEIGKVFKKTDNLLILSRDGTRSALAAKELLDAGFEKVYEVEDGFEGAEFPVFKDNHKNNFTVSWRKGTKFTV
jgi:rhodanese-related sulfurtransferase